MTHLRSALAAATVLAILAGLAEAQQPYEKPAGPPVSTSAQPVTIVSDDEGSGSAGVKDTEQIVDVDEISKAVQQSTEPLYKSLEDTQLKQKFDAVKELLDTGKVDKAELLARLKDLKVSIDQFTGNWENIVGPLWEGHEALAKAIDRIRSKVPADGDHKVPVKIQKLLDSYDSRLHDLAVKIKATEDPTRKKKLEKVFANMLSLRKFTERLGQAGIHRIKVNLMFRTVQILSKLQDQLMDATFELEKVRSILASESDFINDYVEILQMANTANDLLAMLRQMRADGTGLGGIPGKVGDVKISTEKITTGLTNASNSVLDDLESELAKMSEEMANDRSDAVYDQVDLDAEIDKYTQINKVESRIVLE